MGAENPYTLSKEYKPVRNPEIDLSHESLDPYEYPPKDTILPMQRPLLTYLH